MTSEKLSCPLGSFDSKSFHGFITLARWENGTYCLLSVLFGHKNGSSEYFCKKPYQVWPKAVKKFNKHQNAPTRTHKKSQILLYRESFRWINIVLYPLPVKLLFLKGESEILKQLGKGNYFQKFCRGNQKEEDRENAKFIGRWDFFIFIFSYDGTWHCF